jgi:hypothetical protein
LRLSENKGLERIFGPQRDDVTGVPETAERGASSVAFFIKYYLVKSKRMRLTDM